MADQENQRKPHFLLQGTGESQRFTSPQQGGTRGPVPERDRAQHGNTLLNQFQHLAPRFDEARAQQESVGLEEGLGLRVEFESFPGIELAFESLARERSGIELLNVRQEGERTFATVFVPDGKLHILENLVRAYLDESKDTKDGPKNHKLLNAISQIRAATLGALWTDDRTAYPDSEQEPFWWEVWLPVRGDRAGVTGQFMQLAQGAGFEIAPGELQFPERTVLLARGTVGQMKQSMLTLNSIAELRRAKETAEFFDAMTPEEQAEWVEDLSGRLTMAGAGDGTPYVCLLDTGVNNGHPLLRPALDDADLHTVEPGWGVDDSEGHGTEMAGLALFGNLTNALETAEPVDVGHRLESVKLLPTDGANGADARHHGYLTVEAVSRPEVTAPWRARVFSMAITARDNRDWGRPSAWSAAIDRLAADADAQGESPRLFVLSAGNVKDPNAWAQYPHSNSSDGIHDPGQSWNALTVGAFTELVDIAEADAPGYEPIAPEGGLSPFSTTSQTWQKHWPLKPDVVFEGGNTARDGIGAAWMPSLSLLTTHNLTHERLFTTTNATSAASALAGRMAATLMAHYPDLWPESIRALIVHSAEWTPAMCATFLPPRPRPKKSEISALVRHCGFGVPDLERAMWSVDNSLTMVCEERLHPFRREGKAEPTLRDMNLHRLPWPIEELEALGETQVEMKVTLSYFIEPNPSARGVTSKYRYESHGLRFDVKRSEESLEDFQARVNLQAREEEAGSTVSGSDSAWLVGKQNRHKGSVHCDIWRGSATDLASRGVIAVYPALGWWKTRPKLERYDLPVRYALVVSILAPEVDVDLYSAVAGQIEAPVEVQA